jgi:hypothetical protein
MTKTHTLARTIFAPSMATLALLLGSLTQSEFALACGGGGSGSYRKPPKPGAHHQSAGRLPRQETSMEESHGEGSN